MASHSRILARNLLPRPSPLLAPFTRPAMSTISTVAGTTLRGLHISTSLLRRSSGTVITPTLGSMVQNGKLADCALALDRQLKSVDLPTLGRPTMPHFNDMIYRIYDFLYVLHGMSPEKKISSSRKAIFRCKFSNNFLPRQLRPSYHGSPERVSQYAHNKSGGTIIIIFCVFLAYFSGCVYICA